MSSMTPLDRRQTTTVGVIILLMLLAIIRLASAWPPTAGPVTVVEPIEVQPPKVVKVARAGGGRSSNLPDIARADIPDKDAYLQYINRRGGFVAVVKGTPFRLVGMLHDSTTIVPPPDGFELQGGTYRDISAEVLPHLDVEASRVLVHWPAAMQAAFERQLGQWSYADRASQIRIAYRLESGFCVEIQEAQVDGIWQHVAHTFCLGA